MSLTLAAGFGSELLTLGVQYARGKKNAAVK
jgi:hypothetical protein